MATSPFNLRHLNARTAAPIQLKAGTTPVDVLKALDEFFTKHDIELHPMLDPDDVDFGHVPMSKPKDSVYLDKAGLLSFSVQIQGDPHEDLLGKAGAKLLPLMASYGALELIVRFASVDEPIEPEYLGATPALKDYARTQYAMAKAFGHLKPQIGDDGCRLVEHLVNGLSASRRELRISVAPAQVGLLQLSTGHLTKATMGALGGEPKYDAASRQPKLWDVISYTHWSNYGWLIFCSESQAAAVRGEYPELAQIIDLGITSSAWAVLLESEGPMLPGLAVFDHQAGERV